MNNTSDSSQDPKTLEREVDAKRANLNRTLDAVEQRFSPNHLMEQTVEYFGEHGGDIAQSVSRSVKDNPLPLLLTGIGLAWLISTQSQSRSRSPSPSYREPTYRDRLIQWDEEGHRSGNSRSAYARTNSPVSDSGSTDRRTENRFTENDNDDNSVMDDAKQAIDNWAGSASQWRVDLQNKLQSVKQEADESTEQWRDRVISTSVEQAESLDQQYRKARHELLSQGHEYAETTKNWMQEQPLVAGALGVAAGALIGALLPSSRLEDEVVGDRAESVKSSLAQQAESVSDEVTSAVSDSAQALRKKGEEQLDRVESENLETEAT